MYSRTRRHAAPYAAIYGALVFTLIQDLRPTRSPILSPHLSRHARHSIILFDILLPGTEVSVAVEIIGKWMGYMLDWVVIP